MKEIGSEFAIEQLNGSYKNRFQVLNEGIYVFSGRTALETVIKNEPTIHKAKLPSYCCESMIDPFRKAGIEVSYYPVNYENGLVIDINMSDDVDCIVFCNYFGFHTHLSDTNELKNHNYVIIEDITHSLFSKEPYHQYSHYLIASIRKWEPIISGGYCLSRRKTLSIIPKEMPPDSFVNKKNMAMILKSRYLAGETNVNKQDFLKAFSEANKWLADNYSGLTIDDFSNKYIMNVDSENHRKKRIQNARVLYEGLKNNPYIDFMFSIEEMDCPLFVPVLIHNGKRDIIRNKLIEKRIYCPIHWPRPNGCYSNLYDIELSLICDQRYTEEDMTYIVNTLNNI